MSESFSWHGRELALWDAPYNNTRNNERAVELAVAEAWLENETRPGLEIGNVLAHYEFRQPRRIVDLYEVADGVENTDVADIEGSYPWIVSISTIEHVGLDDGRNLPMASTEAIFHLLDCLAPGGRMLVTVPFTANPDLDADIAMGVFGVTRQCSFHRHQADHEPPTWTQAAVPVAPLAPAPLVASATAVWIGEWQT